MAGPPSGRRTSFRLNEYALESLMRQLSQTDFAILVLSADDILHSRGTVNHSPRDNVLLELGLFMGALRRRRTFAVYDSDKTPKIPSDLLGINLATYRGERSDKNLVAAVGEACDVIRDVIVELGPRTPAAPARRR